MLAETGYDGMTIDMVAARAKAGKATLYRRWPSKAELVIDAVACMKEGDLDPAHLPDTGTLRGDLVAMIKPHSIEDGERKLQIMAGLVSMLVRATRARRSRVNAAIVEPRAAVNRILMRRAIDRGEIPADRDIETLSLVDPVDGGVPRADAASKPVDRRVPHLADRRGAAARPRHSVPDAGPELTARTGILGAGGGGQRQESESVSSCRRWSTAGRRSPRRR